MAIILLSSVNHGRGRVAAALSEAVLLVRLGARGVPGEPGRGGGNSGEGGEEGVEVGLEGVAAGVVCIRACTEQGRTPGLCNIPSIGLCFKCKKICRN